MNRMFWFTLLALVVILSAEPLTYQEALNQALSNNPSLSIADLGIEESEEKLVQARASFRPQVKFQGSYTRLGTVPVIKFEPFPGTTYEVPMGQADNYSAGFSISVPLFLGGKRAWAEEMAELGVDAAAEEAVVQRAEIHSQVTAAFYGLMLAEEAQRITEAEVKRAQTQIAQTRKRWEQGYASPLDLKQDEVALYQAKASLVSARNSTVQAAQFLNMVLGREISTPVTTQGDFSLTYQEIEPETLLERGMKLRPEIKALDRAERTAELSGSISRSSYTPSLVLATSPTWQRPYQQEDEWGSSLTATVALEWPIYDGGEGASRARQAQIGLKKLAFSRIQAEQGIELEIRKAHVSWEEAKEQLVVQQRLGEQMVELSAMAEKQYNLGVISSLEYQSIVLSKTQAELGRLSAMYQLIVSFEELRAAAWLWDEETLKEFEESSMKEDMK